MLENLIDDRPITLAPADAPSPPSIRVRLRAWVQQELRGQASVSVPVLAKRAIKTILADTDAGAADARRLVTKFDLVQHATPRTIKTARAQRRTAEESTNGAVAAR